MARIPESTLERKTDEELHALALAIFRNEVFTDRHVDPHDGELLRMVFMPLALMDRKSVLNMQRKLRPGMIYAYMSDAGPRAVNGYPIFFAMYMLHPEDTKIVWEKYDKMSNMGTTTEGERSGQS